MAIQLNGFFDLNKATAIIFKHLFIYVSMCVCVCVCVCVCKYKHRINSWKWSYLFRVWTQYANYASFKRIYSFSTSMKQCVWYRFLSLCQSNDGKMNPDCYFNSHIQHCCEFDHLFPSLLATCFVSFFLRYNSHTVQFSILKYTIEWFLVHSQVCTTTTST